MISDNEIYDYILSLNNDSIDKVWLLNFSKNLLKHFKVKIVKPLKKEIEEKYECLNCGANYREKKEKCIICESEFLEKI